MLSGSYYQLIFHFLKFIFDFGTATRMCFLVKGNKNNSVIWTWRGYTTSHSDTPVTISECGVELREYVKSYQVEAHYI